MHYLVKQLEVHAITCVIDVGASDGEYAVGLRRFGYRGRIVSFEPLAEPYARATRIAARDSQWDILPYALGANDTRVTLNVAGNRGRSSSLLAMLEEHRRALPCAAYVGTQVAEQRTLDGLFEAMVRRDERVHLKLDVQGYERNVLDGARAVLDRPLLLGLQLELSLVPLYDGAWSYTEALEWAEKHAFELWQVLPGFTDQHTGRMLQADGVFFRRGEQG